MAMYSLQTCPSNIGIEPRSVSAAQIFVRFHRWTAVTVDVENYAMR